MTTINWHMRKLAVSALLITALYIVSGCGPIRINKLQDYYGECTFVLPFKHSGINYVGEGIYFNTDYSMEQMVEQVNKAGYSASLHAIGDVKTILISVPQDGFSYYFVIYDKNYFGSTPKVVEMV